MAYQPRFSISPSLLSVVEEIAALRERIQGAAVGLSWIPALQKDSRTRNGHASTAIEGNPLTLEQVRALEEGREIVASGQRFQREVTHYFAGLRYVEKNAGIRQVRHEHLLGLLSDHGSLAPAEIWKLLNVSKQGAMKLMKPLLDAGMVEKRGTAKSGRYFLP